MPDIPTNGTSLKGSFRALLGFPDERVEFYTANYDTQIPEVMSKCSKFLTENMLGQVLVLTFKGSGYGSSLELNSDTHSMTLTKPQFTLWAFMNSLAFPEIEVVKSEILVDSLNTKFKKELGAKIMLVKLEKSQEEAEWNSISF